uniref:EF-hand domain-containing protein n=1 Tax=Eutreptiella gymnastica TaxID=73025 RepID=A0A7S1J1S8_9EUGL
MAQLDDSESLMFKAYLRTDEKLTGTIGESKFQSVIKEFDTELADKEDLPSERKVGDGSFELQLSFVEFLDWFNSLKMDKGHRVNTISWKLAAKMKYMKMATKDAVLPSKINAAFNKLSKEEQLASLKTFKNLVEEVQKWKEYNVYSDDENNAGVMMMIGHRVYKKSAVAADRLGDALAPRQPALLFEAGADQGRLARRQCGLY